MKKILSIITASLVIALIPITYLNAQEKKTEKKIKIIIDNGSGEKVTIDTLFNDNSDIETIKLDGGKIILISNDGDNHPMEDQKGSKHITVTVTSDDDTGKEMKEIRVISSDSVNTTGKDGMEKVYVITSDSDGHNAAGHSNVAVWAEKDEASDGEKIIIVKKVHSADNQSEKSYDVMVTSDENDSFVEKTRYVVAKDGIVVTIEGEDETRAKELIKVIEDHMGVNRKGEEKTQKSEPKKSSKK